MRRRELVASLGLLALPLRSAPAQGRTYRLGILAVDSKVGPDALLEALRDRGYVEGRNLVVEWRFSEGVGERWLALAKELVALKVDVIVCGTTPAALAAKQATTTIPIVIPTAIDPVGAGLAESLARPGGNITGGAILSPEMSVKALSLLKEAVPGLSRVAVLWNAGNPAFVPVWQALNGASGGLGITLAPISVREPTDFASAFKTIAAQAPDGIFVLLDELLFAHLGETIAFAARQRLPSASTVKPFAAMGGLMSYGPSVDAAQRQGADYVDRIFKGANPATLPFQQPTTFELVINLKTAKALGLTVPQILLAQADEVIE
jgi:putative tryptophan/tyrosine transport system substrate-binding protein